MPATPVNSDPFDIVRAIGLRLPDVKAALKYDGSPLLKRGVRFMAGLALHPSAEPGTLIVRAESGDRALMLAEAPETYYVTDYYRRHPVVLVRLAHIHPDVLRELLATSWRMSAERPASAAGHTG